MPDMTCNVWIACLNWAQRKLKIQTAAHDLTDPKGHIRGLPTVQNLNKKWFASRNGITLVRNNEVKYNNIHGQIEKNMTKAQIIMAFEACSNDDARLKCRPVNSMNLLLSFAGTMAHCSRSESDRMEYLVCNFLKDMPGIGSNGHVASCVFTNGGKTNASGKLDYSGSVAHTNPIQSLDAIKGMNYFFRWNVIGEKFPDFTKPEHYYNVPSLRKDTDESTSINYHLLNDKCHLLCDIIGFKSAKSKCNKLIMKLLLTILIM